MLSYSLKNIVHELERDPHNIGIAVSYWFVLHFFCTQWKVFFFNMFTIECFLHPPDETQQGRNRSRVTDMM